ncbi:hypothetical protein AMECASPLE_023665 [Ameca splendens]|uniref:Uncharacterized protein n=1 Tax=Ameca splendens TaxID=208324 RepID=A0ABV0ZDX7_9TELE
MNKDSSLSLLRWTTQIGSLLNFFAPFDLHSKTLFYPLVSRFQFPCSLHCSVNKHFTVKLYLLDCFLHVGQIC